MQDMAISKTGQAMLGVSDGTPCMGVAVMEVNEQKQWRSFVVRKSREIRCHMALWPDFGSLDVHCVDLIIYRVFSALQ